MPLYEYECPTCATEFERIVPFSAADDVACPHCETPHVRRKASRVARRQAGDGEGAQSSAPSCGASGGG